VRAVYSGESATRRRAIVGDGLLAGELGRTRAGSLLDGRHGGLPGSALRVKHRGGLWAASWRNGGFCAIGAATRARLDTVTPQRRFSLKKVAQWLREIAER